jgi:C1A family cysteine protease
MLCLNFSSLAADATGPIGCTPPTPEQKNWMDTHLINTGAVRLNPLGWARVSNGVASREVPAEQIARFGEEVIPASSLPAAGSRAVTAVPAAVDNSTLDAFPPVRSQGSIGSCACFSTTYYTMTHMTGLARGWNNKNTADTQKFSPKWTYNMINGGGDNGSWITTAFAVQMNNGAATWADMPYDSNYLQWSLDANVWRNAINYRMAQTGKVSDVDTPTGLANLKALLANGYVVNYATDIYGWQWGAIGNNPATSADDAFVGKSICKFMKLPFGGSGHAMTVVGYNDDIWVDLNGNGQVEAGEKGALRIVNSWGTGWGEAGFAWISYDALKAASGVSGADNTSRQPCFWYKEAYWITARAAYTPKVLAQVTLNHAKRNQLSVALGIADTSSTTPTTTWSSSAVNYSGGNWAFNGASTAVDGAFVFDFTDIAVSNVNKRWFVRFSDNASGSALTVKSFQLLDISRSLTASATGLPKTIDGLTGNVYVDYMLSTEMPPKFDTTKPLDVTSGPVTGGTTVHISGQYFTDTSSVLFGAFSATNVAITSNGTCITCTTPSNTTDTVSVTVTTPVGSTTLPSAFTYSLAPTVTNISPAFGTIDGGTTVTISGANLSTAQSVKIGNNTLTTFTATATSIVLVTPPDVEKAGNGNVTVACGGGVVIINGSRAAPSGFNYVELPSIDMDTFASATVGTAFSGSVITGGTDPVSYKATGMPSGLILNTTTGAITGTPLKSGAFNVVVTVYNGFYATKVVPFNVLPKTVVENHPPVVMSNAFASPNPATIGDSVLFSVSATDQDKNTLAYTWDFGDGATGIGASIAHKFAASGTYNATVTINDGQDTTTSTVSLVVGKISVLKSAAIRLNFAMSKMDTLKVSGTLDGNFTGSSPACAVTAKVGDLAPVSFILNTMGSGVNFNKTCTFKLTGKVSKAKLFTTPTVLYTLTYSRVSIAASLSALGLENADIAAPGRSVTVPVSITIGNTVYQSSMKMTYTAKKGKSGAAMVLK